MLDSRPARGNNFTTKQGHSKKSLAPPPAPIPRKNLLRPPLHHSHGMRRRKSVTSWSGSSAQSDPRWARHPEDKGSAQHLIPTHPAPKPPGIFSQALQQHSHPEQGCPGGTPRNSILPSHCPNELLEKLNPSNPLSQETPGKMGQRGRKINQDVQQLSGTGILPCQPFLPG